MTKRVSDCVQAKNRYSTTAESVMISFDSVVVKNPHKQDRFLPGTHIPIHTPEKTSETKPHYILILPWNIQEEVIEQMSMVRSWGGQFFSNT